jgi:hypothetical protein
MVNTYTEPKAYYWEIVESSRKLCLTGLMIFVRVCQGSSSSSTCMELCMTRAMD